MRIEDTPTIADIAAARRATVRLFQPRPVPLANTNLFPHAARMVTAA